MHIVWMEKIIYCSLLSKVTSYVFVCKNMNVNICLEADLLCHQLALFQLLETKYSHLDHKIIYVFIVWSLSPKSTNKISV